MAQPTAYDPVIIQKFADKLYSEARSTIVIGTLIGLVVGFSMGMGISGKGQDPNWIIAGIGSVVCALLGLYIGRLRAFSLRMQAQLALCQMKIEENTRR